MRIVKKITYHCGVCGTKYKNVKDARKCEKRKEEPREYKKGDKVKVISYIMACDHREPCFPRTAFEGIGKIVKDTRLQIQDEEYGLKWLWPFVQDVVYRINKMHVRMYEVEFNCRCGKKRSAMVYAPELERMSR